MKKPINPWLGLLGCVVLAFVVALIPLHKTSINSPNPDETPAIINPVPADWKTFSDPETGVTFRYPQDFSTKYVNVVDWPPQVQILNEPSGCTVAGAPSDRAGGTTLQNIGNRSYCVTEVDGAAAGSVFREYAYGTIINAKEIILTFTLQFPQCVNYDDPERSECQAEESSLDIGSVIDQIVSTLAIK